jgi:4-hydroxy-3-methylbut-2-enyl diphosphate reductase
METDDTKGRLQVIRATEMGMCFGVKDALEIAATIERPDDVTIHGDLVHNEEVLRQLSDRGFHMNTETDRHDAVPESPKMLVTAHGISDTERRRLREAGKQLIDTTCPLVRRVHLAAQNLHRRGFFVIVIGKRNHVEVQGIIEDLENFTVVQSVEEVGPYDAPKLGVICQSTTAPTDARRIRKEIESRNPDKEIRFVDTICDPTRVRQEAIRELLEKVEAVVVVGGRTSNNTKQLVHLAEKRGIPSLHVQSAEDLDPAWFEPFRVVGLTAGTSTLDSTIDEVYAALLRL